MSDLKSLRESTKRGDQRRQLPFFGINAKTEWTSTLDLYGSNRRCRSHRAFRISIACPGDSYRRKKCRTPKRCTGAMQESAGQPCHLAKRRQVYCALHAQRMCLSRSQEKKGRLLVRCGDCGREIALAKVCPYCGHRNKPDSINTEDTAKKTAAPRPGCVQGSGFVAQEADA